MAYQNRRDVRPPTEGATEFQRLPSDLSEPPVDNTRDSLPKYYPRDHEVTRWLVNQMRCRNGLHHLVNLANIQPSLLSAYFELFDQPHLYIDAKTGPGMPAYGIKTVLYLTPLAIAIYLRLRSVLRLLLDTSGTRIHARARQEVDINATCYVRRTKPRPGPFIMDEYSTTYPAVIAVRREFFTGINILMSFGFHPQAPIGIIDRLGTTRETTHWFVDLLDFCVKLLNTRPGVDIIGLLQTISYRTMTEGGNLSLCYYDPCVYDVRAVLQDSGRTTNEEVWCSVFHRLAKKGASRSYSNCGNRLIGLLEHISVAGFFRQKYMPKGPVSYDAGTNTRKGKRLAPARKLSPDTINRLTGPEKELARLCIAADRDSALCLLTLWLERVRNRCLDRQAQRLFRLLTSGLADTGLLEDFLFPPPDRDSTTVRHPNWLAIGLSNILNKQNHTGRQSIMQVDFLEDDANEICELEPPQVNEIRQEVGILAHTMGLVDYSEKLSTFGYPRMFEIMPTSGALGDAESFARTQTGTTLSGEGFKESWTTPDEIDSPEHRCASEDIDRKGNQSRVSFGINSFQNTAQRKTPAGGNCRLFWSSPNRHITASPIITSGKPFSVQTVEVQQHNENRNNKTEVSTKISPAAGEALSRHSPPSIEQKPKDLKEETPPKGLLGKSVIHKNAITRSVDRTTQPKHAKRQSSVWRSKMMIKNNET
ncbi:hypothetical protein CRM22_000776 [Opisthorchis felineus]|uniref:Uncharacterized protein n=1 Tax=Opisthorchis felineus TaxID=147828 RepID=A0A4S2MHZ7_OPIFE|nr:hypothetical protein CRM22_000776 [Opisthorchis felineus]